MPSRLKIPKHLTKPLVTKQLIIKVPHGVDPNGIAADVPAAVAAARAPTPGESADFDTRLLVHLMRRQLAKLDPNAVGDPQEYIRQMRAGFNPRDKIEEVLAGSIMLTYSRLAHLSHAAANAKDEFDLLPLYSAADRTANSLRRQLKCFSDYRSLRRNNVFKKNKKSTNEKGLPHAPADAPQALSPHEKRAAIAAIHNSKVQTLETHTRPKNPKRKTPLLPQRLQARRPLPPHLPPPRAANPQPLPNKAHG